MKMPYAATIFILSLVIITSTTLLKINAEKSNNASTLISQVCKKSRNPEMCSRILYSNRRARNASSRLELWKICMELTTSAAHATKKTIAISIPKTNDIARKEKYKLCDADYSQVVYFLKEANRMMRENNFRYMVNLIGSALEKPSICRASFGKPTLSAEPADFKEGNDRFECLCSVLLVISNSLPKKNRFVLFQSNYM
ncbi:hypothetical protein ABFX02_04G122700 [Erythranthe guttata]